MRLSKISAVPIFLAVLAGCGPEGGALDVETEEQALTFGVYCQSQCSDNQMIIGCDDRRRGATSNEEASHGVYKFIGKFDPGCTGTVIADRFVLTAAHCFADMEPRESWFTPSRWNRCSAPKAPIAVKAIYLPQQFGTGSVAQEVHALDFAVAELREPIPDADTMRFGHVALATILGKRANTVGYPFDLGPSGTTLDNTIWFHEDASFTQRGWEHQFDGERGLLTTNLDGAGGQSGGPVWIWKGGRRHLVGVMVGSALTSCMAGDTWASRVNANVEAQIRSLITGNRDPEFWARRRFSLPPYSPASVAGHCN